MILSSIIQILIYTAEWIFFHGNKTLKIEILLFELFFIIFIFFYLSKLHITWNISSIFKLQPMKAWKIQQSFSRCFASVILLKQIHHLSSMVGEGGNTQMFSIRDMPEFLFLSFFFFCFSTVFKTTAPVTTAKVQGCCLRNC